VRMRAKVITAIVVVILLGFVPSNQANATSARQGDEQWELPPVQWNASLDAGYISTAPLLAHGIVVVKVAGSVPGSDSNEPAGLWAFRGDNGEVVWRYNHTASSAGFEVAPLLWVEDSLPEENHPCLSNHSMVVTGWTSGQFTAIDLITGEEIWSHQTEVSTWGITGEPKEISGHIGFGGENSFEVICALNGSLIGSIDYGNDTAYRSGTGFAYATEQFLFLQGTESGHLLVADTEGNLLTNTDLVELANLSGDYRIRSTPSGFAWISADGAVHLSGDDHSILLLLSIDEYGNISLLNQTVLPMGAGTNLGYLNLLLPFTSTSEGVTVWEIADGILLPLIEINATAVSGEVSVVNVDSQDQNMACIPQNTQNGSWLLYHLNVEMTEWRPDHEGYLTAACAGDGLVLAGGNDASWLEVRYRDDDYAAVRDQFVASFGPLDDEPDPEPDPQPDGGNGSPPTTTTESTIPVFLVIPFFGVALVVGLSFLTPNKDLRRQILIFAAIAMLVAVAMATPFLTGMLGPSSEGSSSERPTASSHVGWKSNVPEMVSVAFHFPRNLSPLPEEECGLTHIYGNSVAHYGLSADFKYCIMVISMEVEPEMNVGDATLQALDEAEIDYEFENQILGLFVKLIGPAEGGDENRWWTYDLNGEYGMIGVSDQSVVAGDEIDWHFDDGGY